MTHRRLQRCPTVSFLGHSSVLGIGERRKTCVIFLFLHIQILHGLSPTWSESISTTSGRRTLYKTNAMATPLRKVSENYHLTLKWVRITTAFPPSYDDFAEALGENDEPPHANPICVSFSISLADIPSHIVRGRSEFPTKVENRSGTSFTAFPLESILPPGLYTAIAHNGPLRRRIQDHCDELEEFKAHVRHAQRLLGWLATLYYLILVVVRYALVCAVVVMSSRVVDLTVFLKGYTTRHLAWFHRLRIPAEILGMPCVVRIKQGTSFPSCARFGALFSEPVEVLEGTESEPSVEIRPFSAWRRHFNNP